MITGNLSTAKPGSFFNSLQDDSNTLTFSSTFTISMALSLVIIGSITGNCLVILAIRKDSILQTPANYLICSLAFTDLLVAFLVMPLSATNQILGSWIFGDILCQIWSATDIACCTASILHLCAIALERHQLVTNAVRYFSASKKHAVVTKIAVVWVLAICISIPPVLGWRNSSAIKKNLQKLDSNKTSSKYCEVGHEPGYTVFATLGSFYIPLLLLLFLYGRIYRNIHSYVKRSESRTMLSSVYSEETGSAGKRKSSLLSILRKSFSRGSVKSRKNSQPGNKYPPCENKSSADNNHPHTTLPLFKAEAKMVIKENNMVQENISNAQSQKCKDDNAQTTSPKEFRRKLHSHPSASSPTARVRSKRSAFRHRQMAIDHSNEEMSPKQRKSLVEFRFNHSSILVNNVKKREMPDSTKTIIRRFSEGDIQILQLQDSEKSKRTPTRSRAHTAGARVHFKIETNNLTEYIQPAEIENQQIEPNAYSATQHKNKGKSRFTRSEIEHLTRKQTISDHHPKHFFSCCLNASKQNYTNVIHQSLQDENRPFVRYSFSMRSKIKALKAREIRAIRTLGTIVGAFVICWLPFFIVTIVKPFCSCVISRDVEAVVLWLGYCNSLINPIIYTACNHEFHVAFKRLLDIRCQISVLCKCLARERRLNYV